MEERKSAESATLDGSDAIVLEQPKEREARRGTPSTADRVLREVSAASAWPGTSVRELLLRSLRGIVRHVDGCPIANSVWSDVRACRSVAWMDASDVPVICLGA